MKIENPLLQFDGAGGTEKQHAVGADLVWECQISQSAFRHNQNEVACVVQARTHGHLIGQSRQTKILEEVAVIEVKAHGVTCIGQDQLAVHKLL